MIISIPIIYFGIFFIQNYSLKNSFAKEENTKFDEDTKFIRCNYNILEPEFAFTFGTGDGGRIGFYRPKHFFYQTEQEWDDNDIGGTTIENTTFPELVKMVKKDCSQFQKSKGNYTDETINWSYSSYTPEPVLTPDEQAVKERQDLVENLRLELEWLSEDELKAVEEKYGITKRSMDKDFIEWYEKGLKDGYFQSYAK